MSNITKEKEIALHPKHLQDHLQGEVEWHKEFLPKAALGFHHADSIQKNRLEEKAWLRSKQLFVNVIQKDDGPEWENIREVVDPIQVP